MPTPPPGQPVQMVPGVPPHLAAVRRMQPAVSAGAGLSAAAVPTATGIRRSHIRSQYPATSTAPVTPGALYQLQPYGAPPLQPMSLTGQMRLFEADEIPAQYKVSGGGAAG